MKQKIALLGFRGVGKSTVSRILKKQTGLALIATDHEISQKEGKSISKIVRKDGWNHFRDLEEKYLLKLKDKKKLILDCGGGILEGHDGAFSEKKAAVLKGNFFCIYLYLPDGKLLTRLEKSKRKTSRPNLSGDIKDILKKRKPWFEQLADFTLNTEGLTPGQTAEIIKNKIIQDHA